MKKSLHFLVSTLTIVVSLTMASAPALAARPSHGGGGGGTSVSQTGNDVSWPQCGKSLPSGQLFGIVGVNGGLANTSNPCFSSELAWANTSVGGTGQPLAALYVNTANPGNLGVNDWPTSGVNVYGTCSGGDNQACAYQYGWNMAQADAISRSVPNASGFRWWLDVETGNSWEANTANNVADLEGMTAYFQSIGATVGVYSTSSQWKQITGSSIGQSSHLNGLDSWLPGALKLSAAKSNCSLPGLTAGSKVTVTQYVSRQIDYDYSCI